MLGTPIESQQREELKSSKIAEILMKQDAGTALKRGRVIQWARVAFFRNASTTKSHFRRYFSSKRRSSMLSWHPAHLEGITAVGGGAYGSTTGSRCPFLDLFGRPFFFGVDAGPSTAGGISPDAIELWDVDANARCTPTTRLLMKLSSSNESSSPKFAAGRSWGLTQASQRQVLATCLQ